MTTIRLEFPAGRYHATPHGRHVNEGVPEWPPSPYRLLRALFDVWQRKCADLSQTDVESVLAALAQAPPRFHLPRATATHTRSYLSANAHDPSDKNLVFDAFLAFDAGAACYVSWPDLELTDEQRQALGTLLRNLNYLGRSESWIKAEIHHHEPSGIACDPLELADGYGGEPVPVACAAALDAYSGKRPWLDALTASSAEVLKQRASDPPLLRSVRYLRREDCIDTDPVPAPRRVAPTANAVLLTLDSTVLPLATATLQIAEQIRVRLMGAHRRRMGGDGSQLSPLFSGKDEDGNKRLDHGHVYILPLPDKRSRIDRVLLVSKSRPWSRDELDAVYGVRKLWQADDRPHVRCALSWQGSLADRNIWPESRTFENVTPFVVPRHWRRGRDFTEFLNAEVRRECRNHGLPEPRAITLKKRLARSPFECVEYTRSRKGDPVKPGYALRLEFEQPVSAPFAIGYGAHFGLGMFLPATD
jgi:CRISPR-associated protein Csb2